MNRLERYISKLDQLHLSGGLSGFLKILRDVRRDAPIMEGSLSAWGRLREKVVLEAHELRRINHPEVIETLRILKNQVVRRRTIDHTPSMISMGIDTIRVR